jgi:hypothetical protein
MIFAFLSQHIKIENIFEIVFKIQDESTVVSLLSQVDIEQGWVHFNGVVSHGGK